MRYYCYRHIRLDLNSPFYIGIGKKLDKEFTTWENEYARAYAFGAGKRSSDWHEIYKLCNKNIDVEIIYEAETIDEIRLKEIEFIALYGRANLGKGPLVNLTNGGDGTDGLILTEEHKEIIRETDRNRIFTPEQIAAATERLSKYWGQLHTPESKAKISKGNTGKPRSPEYRKKISDTLKATGASAGTNNPRSRAVLQFAKDGTFIREWSYINEASKELKINNIGAVLSGLQKHSGGFTWKYKDETN